MMYTLESMLRRAQRTVRLSSVLWALLLVTACSQENLVAPTPALEQPNPTAPPFASTATPMPSAISTLPPVLPSAPTVSQPPRPTPVHVPALPPTPSPSLPAVAFPTWWSRQMQTGCKDREPVAFGSPPLRLEEIINIAPYGLMVGAHVIPSDHQGYHFPKKGPVPQYDVLAVADGEVVDLSVRNVSVDTGQPSSPQYHIQIRHSCSIVTQYDLVDELEPSIAAQMGQIRQGKPVPVKEGQVIGKTGYSSQGLDLWVADLRTLASGYVIPDHYTGEAWRIYAIEPFSLFREPLRSQLREKSIRRAEPRGGRAYTDVDGRLIGGWFVKDTNGYPGRNPRDFFRTHIAVTMHAYDPTAIIVSLGDFQGQARQFAVTDNTPDPAQVTVASGMVKYELKYGGYFVGDTGKGWDYQTPTENLRVLPFGEVHGTILLQLVADRLLKVEAFPGKRAAEVTAFTDAALLYER